MGNDIHCNHGWFVQPSRCQVGPVSYHPYCGIVAEEEKEQMKQNVKGRNKVHTYIRTYVRVYNTEYNVNILA